MRLRRGSGPLVLDVTLRDGGYLNDWRFRAETVRRVVHELAAARIDLIEVGYIDAAPSLGISARCTPRTLRDLRGIAGSFTRLAAMLRPSARWSIEGLRQRAPYLDLIRVPFGAGNLGGALAIAKACRAVGVDCSLNLCSVSALSPMMVERVLKECPSTSAFYLADSRGALRPPDVERVVTVARKAWGGLLGFHPHNNLGLAAANSAVALLSGCDMIDGSINGYGLGGGNLDLCHAVNLAADSEGRSGKSLYDVERVAKLSKDLRIPTEAHLSYAYYLAGLKNLEQEWVPLLRQAYGAKVIAYLRSLPRRRYRSLESLAGWDGESRGGTT